MLLPKCVNFINSIINNISTLSLKVICFHMRLFFSFWIAFNAHSSNWLFQHDVPTCIYFITIIRTYKETEEKFRWEPRFYSPEINARFYHAFNALHRIFSKLLNNWTPEIDSSIYGGRMWGGKKKWTNLFTCSRAYVRKQLNFL